MQLTNIGKTDRFLRFAIGLILIAMVFFEPRYSWGWIGLIPLVTAIVQWCPAYFIANVSTCKQADGHSRH